MSNFESKNTPLPDLIKEIKDGVLQLPDFQRSWVWDVDAVISLLNSVAHSFPIGAVMLLETGGDVKFEPRMVEHIRPTNGNTNPERLILDGQQRLTSLAQVLDKDLDGPIKTFDYRKKPIDRYIYINIEEALADPSLENAFVILEKDKTRKSNFGRTVDLDLTSVEHEYEKLYFPSSQILNSNKWEVGLNKHLLDQNSLDKLAIYIEFREKILNAFREYKMPVILLGKSNKKEAVCLVFEKVNEAGEPLTVFELVTASFASENFNLRDAWGTDKTKGIKHRLRKSPLLKSVTSSDFLQTITLLHTHDKRKNDENNGKKGKQATPVSAKRADILKLKVADYKKWVEKAEEGYQQAAIFLEKLCFISHKDIPYRTQVVPLAAVLAMLGEKWRVDVSIEEKLQRWFWCGVFGELYGITVETRSANDMYELLSWIEKDDDNPPRTIKECSFQISRLLSLRSRLSAAYKGISAYVLSKGARDFFYNDYISKLKSERREVDIHHIFPKSWCKKNPAKFSEHFDSIVNKTPISAKSNRSIGDKAPSKYLVSIKKKTTLSDDKIDGVLETHQISSEQIRADDYDAFFKMRMEKLSELIEEAIGKKVEWDIKL